MLLTIDNVSEALREEGKRMTPQRRVVIETLVGNDTHPTPEEVSAAVQARMPGVSLSTIYNILNELASLGFIQRMSRNGLMRFDTRVDDHAHLYCRQCGAIVDLPMDDETSATLSALSHRFEGRIDSVEIGYHGLCENCSG